MVLPEMSSNTNGFTLRIPEGLRRQIDQAVELRRASVPGFTVTDWILEAAYARLGKPVRAMGARSDPAARGEVKVVAMATLERLDPSVRGIGKGSVRGIASASRARRGRAPEKVMPAGLSHSDAQRWLRENRRA